MLLSRPTPQPDECLVSYLIRVSEKNGFKHIGHLMHHAGLDWKNNRAPIHQMLTGEYDVVALLSTLRLPKYQSKISPIFQSFQRGIDTPYILVKSPRVCPECLEELGYCKYQWAFLPIVACSRHKRMLVDVSPTTGKKLGWYRKYLNRFDGEDFPISLSERRLRFGVINHSLCIEMLLSREQPSGSIPVVLQGLQFSEALSLIHFIAHYQIRMLGGSFNPVKMQSQELGHVYENVWGILQAWPDSFYSLLSQYVKKPMSSKGQSGLNKHFRDLYERLYRQNENQGITRIKAEFDRYIDQYWPGVLEPKRITRIKLASTTRNIISKKETAIIFGSRLERVDKLVQQGRLEVVVFKGKAHYLRDQAQALADEISSNWTMDETCEALEITRYQLKQLLVAGVILTLQKPDSLNRGWVIDKNHCLSLVEGLRRRARKLEPPSKAKSMAGIQKQGYSIVQLVLAMQAGEIEFSRLPRTSSSVSFRQFTSFSTSGRF